ncbi:MAG: ComEC/Rec2 family competence protein [candidate division WOR-3 bacterium]
MNKLHPRLSPWFYVSLSMATGILIGGFTQGSTILFGSLLFLALFGTLLKQYDIILFSIFLLVGYIRARPLVKLQKLLKNGEKTIISGEFIVYNEQFLRIPRTSLYFSINPRDLPHGTRVYAKGRLKDNFNRLELLEISIKSASQNFLEKSHQRIKSLIDEIFGKYEEGALIKALILGDRGTLSRKTKENFKYSGSAHVLAISGLHINFLFTMFFTFFMFVLRNKVAADTAGLIIVLLYVLSVGPLAPCYRSFMFLLFNVLGSWFKRKIFALNTWGLAFAISIFFYPNWLTEPSFLFSYFAVLGYIMTSRNTWKPILKATKIVQSYIYTVTVPMIFTLPLQIVFFRYVTLMGLLSNLILLPCTFLTIFETIFCLMFKLINCKIYLTFANCALCLAHLMLKVASFFGEKNILVINF